MSTYPWQESQWAYCLSHINAGTFPHAVLLTGLPGLGKQDFASALSARLLCERTQETACGVCRSCQLLEAGSHPDFFSIGLLDKSKVIKVEQIRQLIDKLSQMPSLSQRQVVVLHPAEAMHPAASNALLKTLEEPLGDVVLLLVSAHPDRLPATIISRCQRLVFNPPPMTEDASAWCKLAGGAPLLAKNHETPENTVLCQLLYQVMVGQGSKVALAEKLAAYDIEWVLTVWMSMLYDWQCLSAGVLVSKTLFSKNWSKLKQIQLPPASYCLEQYARLIRAKRLISMGQSINSHMLLENLLLSSHDC